MAGTSNALRWNAMMFHPGVTGLAGTNGWTAEFEAVLRWVSTGEGIAGSTTGPMLWHFTTAPDGRPAMRLRQGLTLSWPATATNWSPEWAASVSSAQWNAVTNARVTVDGHTAVQLDRQPAQQFFRLRRTP